MHSFWVENRWIQTNSLYIERNNGIAKYINVFETEIEFR